MFPPPAPSAPDLPDAPIPTLQPPVPAPDPVPGGNYGFPPNPDNPTVDVLWEVEWTIRDQQFALPSCTPGAPPRTPVDETFTYKEFVTGTALKIKVRQGRLTSDGCDADYQGFKDTPSAPALEAEYFYSDQIWRPAFESISKVGPARYGKIVVSGIEQITTTTLTKVKRNDIELPIPEPLPDPEPQREPLPVPLRPIIPFPDPVRPLTEPEPEPEPETQPIPSPDTPNAPPFAPPKAPPAEPVEVPSVEPKPLPLPLPLPGTVPETVPGTIPLPVPVPEIPPQTEPDPEPGIVPAPGPAPQPVPNPNPEPGPTPLPDVDPSTDPQETPIPTPIPLPGIDPGVSPSPNPPTLPEGVFPIWPWRRPTPPTNNIVPTTPPGNHYPIRGGPPVTPGGARPSVPAIAAETGRIEQKASSGLEKINAALGFLNLLLDAIGDGVEPGTIYNLKGVCEDVEEGEKQPEQTWIIPEATASAGTLMRLDYIAEMLQVHLNYKTPICAPENEKPNLEGDFRTISFRSENASPFGAARLRKRFRYRSTSGIDLDGIIDHWAGFTFVSGPWCVIHKGSFIGTPQVWAVTVDEGKRVIRHAFAEAGINPDAVGEWVVSRSSSARYGVSDVMTVDTTGGYYWITARDGSDGRPLVARTTSDP